MMDFIVFMYRGKSKTFLHTFLLFNFSEKFSLSKLSVKKYIPE